MASIRYAYAIDANRGARRIDDPDGLKPYRCGDCNGDMVAKRGRVRTHHFAHKGEICQPRQDPDNFLHKLAQDKVVGGFVECQSVAREYRLGIRCTNCEIPITRNIAEHGAKIAKERSIVDGSISDIVLTTPKGQRIIIEIVNTHDLEDQTRRRYEQSGIQVFKRFVTWENVDELDRMIVADETLNRGETKNTCRKCKEY